MSRRRKPLRTAISGAESLVLVCLGSAKHGPHSDYRIARVTAYPNPDAGAAHVVRVHYVHVSDQSAPEPDPVRGTAGDIHLTRTFTCRECGRQVPLRDDNLGALVMLFASLGRARASLADLSGDVR